MQTILSFMRATAGIVDAAAKQGNGVRPVCGHRRCACVIRQAAASASAAKPDRRFHTPPRAGSSGLTSRSWSARYTEASRGSSEPPRSIEAAHSMPSSNLGRPPGPRHLISSPGAIRPGRAEPQLSDDSGAGTGGGVQQPLCLGQIRPTWLRSRGAYLIPDRGPLGKPCR